MIEELLEGEELSVFAIVDGRNVLALPESRDYSRVGDGDTGPNTGGMGSYSPVPELDDGRVAELVETIHRPVVEELAERGTPFIGCLYAGLMLTADGPRVLEFNCRFGDPETQAILPRIEGDLGEALLAAAQGDLGEVELSRREHVRGDGRARRRDVPGGSRRRLADHRRRGGRGARRARLPRRARRCATGSS